MSGPREVLPNVERIAVLRPNAVGDFVFALPALHALRSAYPHARIVYISKQWHADFLHDRPGPIDAVEVIPPCPGVGAPLDVDPSASDEFVARLQVERFDLALQWYGGGRYSNPFIKRLGARLTAGMKAADSEPLDRSIPYVPLANRRLHLLEAAALVGAKGLCPARELDITEADRREAEHHMSANETRPLVVIHPLASDPRRCWPAKRFAAVADTLAEAGARIAINGTADEAPAVRRMMESMRYPALDLSGKLSLSGLCGVLARAALVVSNDSGPLHLALALGTPCVGIYWHTNLYESGPLVQSGHRAALSMRIHCPVCGVENIMSRCRHDVSFLDDVSLAEVQDLALELLQGGHSA
jgi:ADP-heptose:LPS heptosyltransferase